MRQHSRLPSLGVEQEGLRGVGGELEEVRALGLKHAGAQRALAGGSSGSLYRVSDTQRFQVENKKGAEAPL
jgi:hypothetical protein